mmetsp:Transcript_96716/g.216682  ORF Transcript_96716/g.216682 Transcript_96716/m.216682 type:complete len:269 (-) Transcript_96716:91-897(-)
MEAAVGVAVQDIGVGLTQKLQAILKEELASRTAELDRRERELDARNRDVVAREEALQRREAALTSKQSEPAPATPSRPAAPVAPVAPAPQAPPAAPATKTQTEAPQPSVSPGPATDAPTPSRVRTGSASASAVPLLFRAPADEDAGSKAPVEEQAVPSPEPAAAHEVVGRSVTMPPPETTSAGGASQLKDLFEKKAIAARTESSPLQRRPSWKPVQNELPHPDGSGTDRYRAHEAPFKRVSAIPTGSPPPRRTLTDLLQADEQRQRTD